jgi:EAL domain-containing protein (putative c-di-GMP-specific phosphodiesterase class I)/ActR/RegA family two-component response regulator
MAANRLLILDDDPDALHYLGEVGRLCRYEVALAGSAAELQGLYAACDPSMIILDLLHDQGDGIDVMSFLRRQGCRAPIVLVSGVDARVLEAARRVGVARGLNIVGAIPKPAPFDLLGTLLSAHREPELEEWAEDLRRALDHGELIVFYQPKVRIADGSVAGFEALARWAHPSRGLIGPDRVIPVAEATGLIAPLTDQVLAQAVADCAGWAAAGVNVPVAVNVSAPLLKSPEILDTLDRLITAHGVPATSITLEITESIALRSSLNTMEVLSRLRLRGFGLALDDFGTGYANFAMMARIPINELKIDRSVIAEVKDRPESQVIVRAIAALAHQLGLTVVAEGVEDLATRGWLEAVGVDQIQGFGIARPMLPRDVLGWLSGRAQSPPG